jgi:hypothetical protein
MNVSVPQFDVDLATFLRLAVGEDRVVVLLQTGLHAVEAVELDEACAHELVVALVCAQTDLGWVELFEVLGDGLFGCGVREVAWWSSQHWSV